MQYQVNGKNIPNIAVGTWAWGSGINGSKMVFGASPDESELKRAFNTAYKNGFILYDTAAVYGMGNAEKILGKFAADNGIILSDKFTPKKRFNSDLIEKTLTESIDRLKGIIPDIYWLHLPLNIKENLSYMCSLQKFHKIGSIGVSNFSIEQVKIAEKILSENGCKLAGVQNHYSLIYRKHEKSGLVDYCRENNIPFFSYMVLEQGALSGRFNSKNGFPKFSRRGIAFSKSKLKRLEPLHNELRFIGENYGLSISETALLWAISKGTVPIVGVTKEYQAESFLKLKNIILNKAEIEILEKTAQDTGVEIAGSWE